MRLSHSVLVLISLLFLQVQFSFFQITSSQTGLITSTSADLSLVFELASVRGSVPVIEQTKTFEANLKQIIKRNASLCKVEKLGTSVL